MNRRAVAGLGRARTGGIQGSRQGEEGQLWEAWTQQTNSPGLWGQRRRLGGWEAPPCGPWENEDATEKQLSPGTVVV